jgi:hypothetical protein
MNTIVIFRDQDGKITGAASHAENGEVVPVDFPEYQEWLSSSNNISNWAIVRSRRDQLLKDSDWAIMSDATPKPSKEAWLSYRQALRDLPEKFEKPEQVVWPKIPNK